MANIGLAGSQITGKFVSSGSSITLKTNGVNNGSQSILNLTAGTGVTVTDGGGGLVTVAATGGSTPSVPLPGTTRWFYVTSDMNTQGYQVIGSNFQQKQSGAGAHNLGATSSTNPFCDHWTSTNGGTTSVSLTSDDSSHFLWYVGRTGQKIRWQCLFKTEQTIDSTYQLFLGLSDTTDPIQFTSKPTGNCIGFWTPGAVSGPTQGWNALTQTSASNETLTQFSAGDTSWHVFEFDYDQAGGNVKFYYDGTLVATQTTNIPAGVLMNWWCVQHGETGGGSTARNFDLAWVYGEATPF